MPGGDILRFPDVPIPPRPVTPGASSRAKLRKKRADGYESDGGYISEGGKKKKDKKKDLVKEDVMVGGGSNVDLNSAVDKKERAKEAKARVKEEKILEKKEKEEERKRKKSLASAAKASKKMDDNGPSAMGYETDGATKSPNKTKAKKSRSKPSADGGYETDSGYVSSTSAGLKAKTKSRFFRLGTKQSKPDLRQDESPTPSPVIEKEVVPLPIASRFATTLGSPSSVSSSSTNVATPLPSGTSMDTSYSPSLTYTPSPPLPTSTYSYSPTFLREAPVDRDSYSSGGSGSSSASAHRRRGVQFIAKDNAHGAGGTSFSTIAPASQTPLPRSVSVSPASPASKFPVISLPLTHSPATTSHSLSPPSSAHDMSRFPSNTLAPAPFSPHYPPSAISNPTSRNPSRAASPSLGGRGSPMIHFTPSLSSPSQPLRPRFPPTDGFGVRPSPSPGGLSLGPANTRLQNTEQPLDAARRPTLSQLTIVPSSDYIVPSPGASPLPSPHVLAYYDIPPPSPPPAGPLPTVPRDAHSMHARNNVPGSISRSRTPEQGMYSQPMPNIQRGREAPFPSRPILPSAVPGNGGVSGLEARVKVPRYRELYALTAPPDGWSASDHRQGARGNSMNPGIHVIEPTEDGWDYDDDEEDMRNVLDRFEEARVDAESGRALGRSRSFEALRGRPSERGYVTDEYLEEQTSTEESGGQRNSRWSGSIYSRTSILEPDKSEETRERFIQRVEDMYGDNGREKIGGRQAIPPVPRLPESFVGAGAPAPGRSWNRF